MFAESIEKANDSGRNKWGVTHSKSDRVRLNVGSLVACTLHADKIWFALDSNYAGTSDKYYLDKHDCWTWTPINYEPVPSISGIYKPSTAEKHAEMWPRIRKMHFAFIDNAADKYKRLSKKIQPAHSPEFLEHLRGKLSQPDLPNPIY